MDTLHQTLTNLGLEPLASTIYLLLIKEGELSVSLIQKHTNLSRTSIYEGLSVLLANSLVEYRKEGK